MASCLRNICAKNCYNLLILIQVKIEKVWDVFLRHCSFCDLVSSWCVICW